jgi:hypothetical protein
MGAVTALMYTAKAEERRAEGEEGVMVPATLVLDSPFASLLKLIPEVVDSADGKGQYVRTASLGERRQQSWLTRHTRHRLSKYRRRWWADCSDWASRFCARLSKLAPSSTSPTSSPSQWRPSAVSLPYLFKVSTLR